MLERLLSCMGYQLEVVRRPVQPMLTRSAERSWQLHRQLSTHLTAETWRLWEPVVSSNLDRLQAGVRGQPHLRNLDRWRGLVDGGDIGAIRRVMTGLDSDSIEMREVSPRGGLLLDEERLRVVMAVC